MKTLDNPVLYAGSVPSSPSTTISQAAADLYDAIITQTPEGVPGSAAQPAVFAFPKMLPQPLKPRSPGTRARACWKEARRGNR